jgi:hypothetical protein
VYILSSHFNTVTFWMILRFLLNSL